MRRLNFVLPRVILFILILWLFAIVLLFIVENVSAQDELTYEQYISIAIDFYSKTDECFAYPIVANGLIYFLAPTGETKQIGNYTDIESYLQGGLEYIQKACK